MPIGLVGRKCGMTRIFTDAGESIPVRDGVLSIARRIEESGVDRARKMRARGR